MSRSVQPVGKPELASHACRIAWTEADAVDLVDEPRDVPVDLVLGRVAAGIEELPRAEEGLIPAGVDVGIAGVLEDAGRQHPAAHGFPGYVRPVASIFG